MRRREGEGKEESRGAGTRSRTWTRRREGRGGRPAATPAIRLNQATFEQLRELGFSVTQATRVLTYRERMDGFSSLDDLDEVPGMPEPFLTDVKLKLRL